MIDEQPIIYLAHPIDAADRSILDVMLEVVADEAHQRRFAYYRPQHMVGNAMAAPKSTMSIQRNAIVHSEGLLLLWPEGASSVGGPIEVYIAKELGKPVAIVGGHHSMIFKAMDLPTFDREVDALDWLLEKIRERRAIPPHAHGIASIFQVPPALVHSDVPLTATFNGEPLGRWEPTVPHVRWAGDPEFEPQRFHEGDAGYDLVVAESVVIQPDGFFDVPHGIRVALPDGVWGRITGRSSTLRKRHLLVAEGIIDNGYRGELFAGVWNLGSKVARIDKGERIAQLILHPAVTDRVQLERVADVGGDTTRGESGFGSTDKLERLPITYRPETP